MILRIIALDGSSADVPGLADECPGFGIGDVFAVNGRRYIVADEEIEQDQPEMVRTAMELKSDG